METTEEIKSVVKEKYGEIAKQSKKSASSSCCGGSERGNTVDYTTFALDYSKLKGYNPDANLGLGCGMPTEFALIKEGDTVLDLGSGAGNDVFVAREITGEKGRVIGLDFTEEMILKARENNEKLGFKNVEFLYGDIESIPLFKNSIDVIVSNCVLNLVPDKKKAFSEIYRILKPGGHLSISDIVTSGELPEKIRKSAVVYAGCVGGALNKEDYLKIISDAGFKNIKVQKERIFSVPDDVLSKYLTSDEMDEFKTSMTNVMSINVYAEKPLQESRVQAKSCCGR